MRFPQHCRSVTVYFYYFFPFFSELSKHDLLLQNYSSNAKLKRFYRVLTTNTDGKEEFISTMEGMNATEHLFVYMCDVIHHSGRPTISCFPLNWDHP